MLTFIPLLSISLFACGDKEEDTGSQDTDTGVEDTDTGSEDTGDTGPEDTGDTEDTGETGDTDSGDTSTDAFVLEDELQGPNGCGDFLFFDRNVDDTIVLEIRGNGLAEIAHTIGEPQQFEVDLEQTGDISAVVNMGLNLSHHLCNDALDPNIAVLVEKTYIPVNGLLSFTVTANGQSMGFGDFPAEMEVQLTGADFCADTGDGTPHHEDCFNVGSYSGVAQIGWLGG
jgi:hypothetical protein